MRLKRRSRCPISMQITGRAVRVPIGLKTTAPRRCFDSVSFDFASLAMETSEKAAEHDVASPSITASPGPLHDEPQAIDAPTAEQEKESETGTGTRRRKTTAFAADDGSASLDRSNGRAERTGAGERSDSPGRPPRTNTERSRRSANRSNTGQSSLSRAFTQVFTPEKKLAKDPTFISSLWAIVKASWLNVLLGGGCNRCAS